MATFVTPDGDTVPSVTAAEMREVDRVAVEAVGLGLLQMMENAGRNLAATALDAGGPVTVFAGAGGNGGGGLCCARHLANHGVEVRVVLDRDPADLEGAAATQLGILDAAGVPVEGPGATPEPEGLAVDAIIGYGLRDAPRGRAMELIEACDRADRVLSLDVPSGRDATTGEAPGAVVEPDRTLTLALPKAGLAAAGGDLLLGDIGIPAGVYERAGIDYDSPFDGRYRLPIRRD